MNLPLIIRPPAKADIGEIREGSKAIRSAFGERFAARVREGLERIESNP